MTTDWMNVRTRKGTKIARLCGVYEFRDVGRVPGVSYKIKVVQEGSEQFVAVPNFAVLPEDGTPPPGAIAYGQTELEALQSSIDKVDSMLEALHGDRSEHRFEWSDPGEF